MSPLLPPCANAFYCVEGGICRETSHSQRLSKNRRRAHRAEDQIRRITKGERGSDDGLVERKGGATTGTDRLEKCAKRGREPEETNLEREEFAGEGGAGAER